MKIEFAVAFSMSVRAMNVELLALNVVTPEFIFNVVRLSKRPPDISILEAVKDIVVC